MVAMARALAVNPSILLVDELSMGLAPKIVEQVVIVAGVLLARALVLAPDVLLLDEPLQLLQLRPHLFA